MGTDRTRGPDRIRVVVGRGARSCERRLLEDLDGLLEAGEAGGEPIVLLVPSDSLRQHLLTRIVRRRGRGVAGLACFTLHRIAVEVVSRMRPATPVAGADLFPVLARREARREAALRRSLDHLRDGYGAVLAAVRDLLDAGLEPAHAEGLDEALAAEGPAVAARPELERARAVVRVAARTVESMSELGLGRGSTLLREAAELLRGDGGNVFAARTVLVHGFSDATGVGTDLIEALLRRYGGRVYLDRPADPGDPERDDPGERYSRHFTERLALLAEPETLGAAEATPGRVQMFRALGAEAELREVSRRIRELLDGGVEPESIGLVARSFDAYRSSLAAQLRRRAIPFSGSAPAVAPGAVTRRLRALLDLLRLRQRTPTERWLEASGERAHRVAVYDLRMALFSLGAGRLDEVAALSLDGLLVGDTYPLPVRRGFWRPDEDADDRDEDDTAAASTRLSKRRVPGAALRRAMEAAGRLTRRLESWSAGGPLEEHLARLRALLFEELGWGREEPLALEVIERLEGSLAGTSRRLVLDLDEFLMLLEQALDGLGAEGPGGKGGGVQVLDVTEARGRTFEHLFVVGLNRGVFPRAVREDPLLSDALRAVLARHGAGVLPDLPMKLAGYDEERYLFAQLLSAAPRVTLSWQQVDDDNQSVAPSPLVERLRFTPGRAESDTGQWLPIVPPFPAPLAGRAFSAGDRPARDNAVLLALEGRREALPAVFAAALRQSPKTGLEPAGEEAPGPSSEELGALGRVRTAVLEEIDPRRGEPEGEARRRRLGPHFGLVGTTGPGDPRGGRLFVTTLERLAGCPWQAFLEKLLRLEPPPDPLASLPALDPLLVGKLVHRVLESAVRRQLGGEGDPPAELDELTGRAGVAVAWPDADALEALALEEARQLVRESGIGLGGFAGVLARAVLPYLAVARRLDWSEREPPETVGVEVRGAVEIPRPDGPRSLYFKADRVDRRGGRLLLTDYKTGRSFSVATTPKARRRALVKEVASGGWLQAPVYSLAGGAGRFLFLSPLFKGPEPARQAEVEAGDLELRRVFLAAADAALGAWEEGVFFPRLEEARQPREPRRCAHCQVKEACLRGDSGARARLRDWMRARESGETAPEPAGGSGSPPGPAERAAVELWFLGASSGQGSAGR